ncbi:MAG: 5'-nucleotidase [Balneolaceae bacterium]
MILLISGCSTTEKVEIKQPAFTEQEIENATLTEDTKIAELLDQHREGYRAEMGSVLTMIEEPLTFEKPESSLGNIVADALRYRASREALQLVHIGIIGDGSFRLNLNQGPLTMGDVYEFMPYENHLVMLKLTGDQVLELADQIAEQGGSPISGMRFQLENNRARGVIVNSQVVSSNQEYWVATSNYVADGGDNFPVLWEAQERIDFDLSIKELYVDHFRNRKMTEPFKDGRIRQ